MTSYIPKVTFLVWSIFFCCGQSFASNKVEMCHCYDTPTITVEHFVDAEKDTITSLTSSCRDNFFVTSVSQTPEKNPTVTGQFLIISSLRCCQLCLS